MPPERVPEAAEELRGRVKQLERAARQEPSGQGADLEALAGEAIEVDGARVLATSVSGVSGQGLLALSDQLRAKLGEAAVVLGNPAEGKVELVAAVAPELVARGVRADDVVRVAAERVGGGGGGRDTLARAGGREVAKLPDALAAAREAIETALGG